MSIYAKCAWCDTINVINDNSKTLSCQNCGGQIDLSKNNTIVEQKRVNYPKYKQEYNYEACSGIMIPNMSVNFYCGSGVL